MFIVSISMATILGFINVGIRCLNVNQIEVFIRQTIETTAGPLPAFRVRFIQPGVAFTYVEGSLGFSRITDFLAVAPPNFCDLGSVVVNLNTVSQIEKVLPPSAPPYINIKFTNGEVDEELTYVKGSPEYDIISKKLKF